MVLNLKNKKFRLYEVRDTDETAILYKEAMPDDFVSQFGSKLLKLINIELATSDYSSGIVFEEYGKLGGYIAYTLNSSKLYSNVVRKHFFKILLIFGTKLLTSPKFLFEYFKVRSVMKKLNSQSTQVELIIAGLKPEFRGRKIGKVIYIKAMEDCLLRGATEIKAIIHEEDPVINNLYKKLGFKERERMKFRNTIRKIMVFSINDQESMEIYKNALDLVNKIESTI